MPLAWLTKRQNPTEQLKDVLNYSHLLTELVGTAQKSAQTQAIGWIGRKKHGVGENFWQFRSYREGDTPQQIDWRRSARDDRLYIREREWETQQTIWIWPDQSESMRLRSKKAKRSKLEQALLLSFILGELMLRSGDHIGIPEILKPISHKNGAEKMALALLNYQKSQQEKNDTEIFPKFPNFKTVKTPCDIIIISDFLLPDLTKTKAEDLLLFQTLKKLDQQKARIHLIEIIDPVEEDFPYRGAVHFHDISSQENLIIERADVLKNAYQNLYLQKRQILKDLTQQYHWTYLQNYTHQSLEPTLARLAHVFSRLNTYI